MTTGNTRGIRNNNPGNIDWHANVKWQGQVGKELRKNARFIRFISPVYGIRAIARVLISYSKKHNLNTVEGIINRWAPPSENNSNAYASAVANELGVPIGQEINVLDYDVMSVLVKAIIRHENGKQPYNDAQISKGLVMAGLTPGVKELKGSRTIKGGKVATGAIVSSTVATIAQNAAPAIPIVQTLAEYAPYVLMVIALAGIGYMIWARIDDNQKGLR